MKLTTVIILLFGLLSLPTVFAKVQGTYFLGPSITSYTQLFGYYYQVSSTNPNYFERSSIGGSIIYYPVSQLANLYKEAGATNLQASNAYGNYIIPTVGYSNIQIGSLPNNATLTLFLTTDSRSGNMNTTIALCLTANPIANCLGQDQIDMINQLNVTTNINLPKINYMNEGLFIVLVIIAVIVGMIAICLLIASMYSCWLWNKHRHHTTTNDKYFDLL